MSRRAGRPYKLSDARLPRRTHVRLTDVEQAALAFNHNVASIGGRLCDQSDMELRIRNVFGFIDLFHDPFRAASCFAVSATGAHEPYSPIALGRQLLLTRPKAPVIYQNRGFFFR